MTDHGTDLMTIGEVARTTGLPVRAIRYRSDEGALPPVTRSAGGYRLHDAGPAVVLERRTAVTNVRLAPYREPSAIVHGLEPPSAHEEQFRWVVAALGARTAG